LIEKDGAMELSSLVIHVVRDFLDYYRLQFDGNAGQHENVCELVKCISGDRVSINRCVFLKVLMLNDCGLNVSSLQLFRDKEPNSKVYLENNLIEIRESNFRNPSTC
jgi:hypothetical protein